MKCCSDCRKLRPLEDFHVSGRSLRANCKYCRAVLDRRDKLRRFYDIDVETYDSLLESQGGVCASCGQPETSLSRTGEIKFLAVDHDHSCCPGQKTCGQCIRGLLCSRCNLVLGLVEDDKTLLIDAVLYLRRSERK